MKKLSVITNENLAEMILKNATVDSYFSNETIFDFHNNYEKWNKIYHILTIIRPASIENEICNVEEIIETYKKAFMEFIKSITIV